MDVDPEDRRVGGLDEPRRIVCFAIVCFSSVFYVYAFTMIYRVYQ